MWRFHALREWVRATNLVHDYRHPTRARKPQAHRSGRELFLDFVIDHPHWHSAVLASFFTADIPRVRFINRICGGFGVHSMFVKVS